MKSASLQTKMDGAGGALKMLRTSRAGPYVFPIKPEFSSWQEEQRAWRERVALMDLSYHMSDIYVEGPDVKKLLSYLGVNSFDTFGPGKAKQLVTCAPSGHLIGDMILFGLDEFRYNIAGRPTVANWIEYHASTGKFDVKATRDDRSVDNNNRRRVFRYQVQGPNAWAVLEFLNGGKLEIPKFFQMGKLKVAGHELSFLRHGMGGAPGLELWGDMALAEEIKEKILAAGAEFDIRQVGGRAYGTSVVDSGWLPCPLPAIYTGEEMRPYREWLPAASYDGVASMGGSFVSERIEDYYFTPWELDYGRVIKFDHDFVGREALQKLSTAPQRKKVSLVWNADDVTSVYRSSMNAGDRCKYMDMPIANYASYPYDQVLDSRGAPVGVSTYCAFLAAEGAWVSLAVVDENQSLEGTDLAVVWGEPSGSPRRPMVEPHRQTTVRAKVTKWPISPLARDGYRPAK